MASEPVEVAGRARRTRTSVLRHAWVRIAGLASALAVVASLVGFAQQNSWLELWGSPDDPDPTSTAADTTTTTPPTTAPPSPPVPSGGTQEQRLLAELPPVVGAAQLVPLRGAQDAAVSLGLRCAAGTTQDRQREVRYRLTAPYERFTAGVVTTEVEDPEAAVQVEVLSGRRVVETLVVRGNTSAPLAADLSDDLEVGLRVTCQRPGGFVVVRRPAVLRGT